MIYLDIFVIIRIDPTLLISIKNFKSIPSQLYDILFAEEHKDQNKDAIKSQLSFMGMARTFPHLSGLTLTDLDFSDFLVNIEQYINAIDNFVDNKNELKTQYYKNII